MSKGNGTVWKWIAGALLTLLLASAVWIWNAAGEAAGVVKDVQANQEDIAETKTNIQEEVRPVLSANKEAVIGIKKDIERLEEKVGRLDTAQREMITEQRAAFKAVMDRLPKNNTPGG